MERDEVEGGRDGKEGEGDGNGHQWMGMDISGWEKWGETDWDDVGWMGRQGMR